MQSERRISPNSKLKALGKTPSLYNRDRLATGIKDWTEHVVTEHDFARWSKEPDYGICVRTGNGWLALDCDSEDVDVQQKIRDLLAQLLGVVPPRRRRANSNKCLYLLGVEGDFRKRIHRLEGELGIIELLANGQQFVACGTHSSGARIEWDNELPDDPPAVTTDQLETLWQQLADVLPVSVTTEAGSSKMRDRSTFTPGATDETAEYLDANGWTLLDGTNGERYIRCPFEDGHSTGGDPTSTVYFPAGTAGFDLGHFKCLHASCAHRNDGDYLNAIGIRTDDFEDLTSTEVAEPLPLPAFERDKWGRIEATISNAAKAVVRPDFVDIDIRFDQFRDEIMFAPAGSGQWQAFTDPDYARLRITMEKRGFKAVGRELIRDVVLLAADEQPFDSATTWLNGLEWDGVPRIEHFYHTTSVPPIRHTPARCPCTCGRRWRAGCWSPASKPTWCLFSSAGRAAASPRVLRRSAPILLSSQRYRSLRKTTTSRARCAGDWSPRLASCAALTPKSWNPSRHL
ncbi:Predicted P-loop ATPase and inactivated derivatives [Klebsiella pneumoniae subsp. rhinoscleromatis]|nr:Predicted P-loop ATPase and inactivated derivatives [Klebsiella pneumoniae subsp. rhinoscleromatis]